MRNCFTCKHCWQDYSVGDRECMLLDEFPNILTEKEIVKYYEDAEENCPYYENDMDIDN